MRTRALALVLLAAVIGSACTESDRVASVPTQDLILEVVRSDQVSGDERSISADIILAPDVSPSDVLRLSRDILRQYSGVVAVWLWERREHFEEDRIWKEESSTDPSIREPDSGPLFVLMRSPAGAESGLWAVAPEGDVFAEVAGTFVNF
jgi:hypothetical protein